MTKMIFKNLPDKSTPAKAENLNALNNLAIDTTIDNHDEEVVFKKANNIARYYTNTTDSTQYVAALMVEFDLKPNQTYTIFYKGANGHRIYTNESIVSGYAHNVCNGSLESITFTIKPNYKESDHRTEGWIIFKNNGGNTIVPNFTNVMIVEGAYTTSDLSYEPYVTNEVYADGKKYTDTVNIGTLSNNSGLWIEHSKNLLKINDFTNTSNGLTLTAKNGKITITGTATDTYFSLNLNSNINLAELKALTLGTTLTFSVLDIKGIQAKQVFINTDGHDYYYQPNSTTKYVTNSLISTISSIQIYFNTTVGTEYNIAFSPMLELGNTAHDFEPYKIPNIKVNNNGVYETIANKNVYSPEEVVIGKWLGKPLYRKVLTGKMGTCTTDGTYGPANTISISSNIETIVNLNATMKIGNQVYPLMYMNNSSMVAKCLFDGGNGVQLTTNGTAFSQQNCTIIAEYTKTTDTTSTASVVSDEVVVDGPTI